jgi:hypothetical protein
MLQFDGFSDDLIILTSSIAINHFANCLVMCFQFLGSYYSVLHSVAVVWSFHELRPLYFFSEPAQITRVVEHTENSLSQLFFMKGVLLYKIRNKILLAIKMEQETKLSIPYQYI